MAIGSLNFNSQKKTISEMDSISNSLNQIYNTFSKQNIPSCNNDLNNITKTGIYSIPDQTTWLNKPDQVGTGWFFLLHMEHSVTEPGLFATQVAYTMNSQQNIMHVRTKFRSTWTKWNTFYGNSYIKIITNVDVLDYIINTVYPGGSLFFRGFPCINAPINSRNDTSTNNDFYYYAIRNSDTVRKYIKVIALDVRTNEIYVNTMTADTWWGWTRFLKKEEVIFESFVLNPANSKTITITLGNNADTNSVHVSNGDSNAYPYSIIGHVLVHGSNSLKVLLSTAVNNNIRINVMYRTYNSSY